MFIPTTIDEVKKRGWDALDVVLVTGDTYIDSCYMGPSLIGQLLISGGCRTGIIAQPNINDSGDITRLGEPLLFWGVTSGSVDSMVSNYTSSGKRRMKDDFTPGGINNRRPDRALIAYTNLIRRNFKNTVPVVLGGIEASLRRIAHYDFRSNSVRRSVLFDAKADLLVYGMGESQAIQLAETIKKHGREYRHRLDDIRGICYISSTEKEDYVVLPTFEEAAADKNSFTDMFKTFCLNNDPYSASGLVQKHGERFLVHNPPAYLPGEDELDMIYRLPFERRVHPFYAAGGKVRAMDTIRFSITSHRGCGGGCGFCGIAIHQGRRIVSRSEESIISEAETMVKHPDFKGIISDVGGPTANMYGMRCETNAGRGYCSGKDCLYPEVCGGLKLNHDGQIRLLRALRKIKGIKKVFVSSGIRHDLILQDGEKGASYLEELMKYHISGQMKIAPEHTEHQVLRLMRKSSREVLDEFIDLFNRIKKKTDNDIYLTYYFIAAHPGCTDDHMKSLKRYTVSRLKMVPRQAQIFTPTPSTWSTLCYHTGNDPSTGRKIFVETDMEKKIRQKNRITGTKKK